MVYDRRSDEIASLSIALFAEGVKKAVKFFSLTAFHTWAMTCN